MENRPQSFLNKAMESLLGALSEGANGRYNNATNRCYYAAYQAAVAALVAALGPRDEWYHDQAQALFAGELIRKRKLYPAALRSVLYELYDLRIIADYSGNDVGRTRSDRALKRMQAFVTTVERQIGR